MVLYSPAADTITYLFQLMVSVFFFADTDHVIYK